MNTELARYEIDRKKAYCRQLMADRNNRDDPDTVAFVASMMAEVRIAEANLRHDPVAVAA